MCQHTALAPWYREPAYISFTSLGSNLGAIEAMSTDMIDGNLDPTHNEFIRFEVVL